MSILFYINIEEASARVHMARLQHSEAQVPPPGSEGWQPAPQKHGSSGTDFYGAKAPDLACDQMISCAWHQEGTRLALEEQGPKTRQFMLEFCALDDGQEHIPKMRAPNLIKQVTVKSGAASCCHEEASDTAWMKGLRGFQLI